MHMPAYGYGCSACVALYACLFCMLCLCLPPAKGQVSHVIDTLETREPPPHSGHQSARHVCLCLTLTKRIHLLFDLAYLT